MASVEVIVAGYARSDGEVARVAGTVSLVRAPGLTVVVDPGMVASQAEILDPLAALGVRPEQVTDVVISHHHPDHTINVGLFPAATVHDHWATYRGDVWRDRPAEGARLADDVVLWATPGHTPQDITTVVHTPDGVVALTHLWWHASMDGDPRASDLAGLHAGRERVLAVAHRIVPGHGPAFDVTPMVPR